MTTDIAYRELDAEEAEGHAAYLAAGGAAAPGRDDAPALPPLPPPSRTLTSYARRDVRNTVAKIRGW